MSKKGRPDVYLDVLLRIESLLKQILFHLEIKPIPPASAPIKPKPKSNLAKNEKNGPQGAQLVIAAYIDAWQERFKTNARPRIGSIEAGIAKRIAPMYPAYEWPIIFQAYMQMEDPWFKTKAYDFVTAYENLTKIVLALDKGRNNPLERTWEDIVEERERERGDDKGALRIGDEET